MGYLELLERIKGQALSLKKLENFVKSNSSMSYSAQWATIELRVWSSDYLEPLKKDSWSWHKNAQNRR